MNCVKPHVFDGKIVANLDAKLKHLQATIGISCAVFSIISLFFNLFAGISQPSGIIAMVIFVVLIFGVFGVLLILAVKEKSITNKYVNLRNQIKDKEEVSLSTLHFKSKGTKYTLESAILALIETGNLLGYELANDGYVVQIKTNQQRPMLAQQSMKEFEQQEVEQEVEGHKGRQKEKHLQTKDTPRAAPKKCPCCGARVLKNVCQSCRSEF